MKEALYYSDRKVATISKKEDKDNINKMKAYFGTLCASQESTAAEKTWEHYVSPYYPKNGNIPFYYILYKNYENEQALDLCPLDSPNNDYIYDNDPDYKSLGKARETHTICQFPNFKLLKDNTRKIIFDDEAETDDNDNEDNTFFKEICSVNNKMMDKMTQEMKTLVDSIDPTRARNGITTPVNFKKPTHINKKRRHLEPFSTEDLSWKNQRRNSMSSGGSTSYDSNQSLNNDIQSTSEKHKNQLVHRTHRGAGILAASVIGTVALSPLIALLNVAVVDSVYGDEDENKKDEIKLDDFKMGDQILNNEFKNLQMMTKMSLEQQDVGIQHRNLIHIESSLMHIFDSIYDNMKTLTNNLLALITQANIGNASPAWLSTEELSNLKTNFALQNNTMIETEYKRITMSLARRGDNYIIKYGLPVMDSDKKVNLFFIIPIPVFKNNETHLAILETPFVAISYTGRFYTPLTMEEANKCMKTPKCQAESPTYEATYPTCGASDFYKPSNQCLYTVKPGMRPFFKTIGRIVYYNLPKNQSLFIHCFDEKLNIPGEEKELKLAATTGNLTLPLTCEARTKLTTIMAARNSDSLHSSKTAPVEILENTNESQAQTMELMEIVDSIMTETEWIAGYPARVVTDIYSYILYISTISLILLAISIIIYLMRGPIWTLCTWICTLRRQNNNSTLDSIESYNKPMKTSTDEDELDFDTTSPGKAKIASSPMPTLRRNNTFVEQENGYEFQMRNPMVPSQTELSPMDDRFMHRHETNTETRV
jgi:hypothetical protein